MIQGFRADMAAVEPMTTAAFGFVIDFPAHGGNQNGKFGPVMALST
jgi:hypothetical protein